MDRQLDALPPLFEIRVRAAGLTLGQGVGTLDHGNIQAHTPGSFGKP